MSSPFSIPWLKNKVSALLNQTQTCSNGPNGTGQNPDLGPHPERVDDKNFSSYPWLAWELAEPGCVDWPLIWDAGSKDLHWVCLLSAAVNWLDRGYFVIGIVSRGGFRERCIPLIQSLILWYGQFLSLNSCGMQQFKASSLAKTPSLGYFPE